MRAPRTSARRGAEPARGFTLIEVLVAFAVAALLLVPLLRIFSGGIGGLRRADRAAGAALWAESVLEARDGEAPLAPGAEDGDLPDGYHWHRTVARYADAALPSQQTALVPYDVTLTVSWQERGRTREVTLETLRLAPPPLQQPPP
jgi:general secretion pathway protein I